MTTSSRPAPIRVCMIIAHYGAGEWGAEKQARQLVEELLRTDEVSVDVLARAHGDQQSNGNVQYVPLSAVGGKLGALVFVVGAVAYLLANRRRYDVLHAHQISSPALIGVVASVLTGRPLICKATSSGATGEVLELRRRPLGALRAKLLRGVTRFVALNPEMRADLETIGIDRARIEMIENGVALPSTPNTSSSIAAAREALGIELDRRVVVFVGRLERAKGFDDLLHAWPEVVAKQPSAMLLAVGSCPGGAAELARYERRAAELGIEGSVHFVGRVGDVGPYLRAADVFTLPTWTEGMSNAILEAMAQGLAIVTTGIPANGFLSDDEVVKIPVSDPRALSAALSTVLGDDVRRAALARNVRRRVEAGLTFEHLASRYIGLYRRLVEAR